MSIVSDVLERLRTLVFRARQEREMDEELRFHVEMQTEANRRAGMSPIEARRRALIALGGVERFKEEWRDARGVRWLEDVGRDIRYAFRRLRRSPIYSLTVVATLALGIGVAAAVFGLVDTVLLRPLPYPRPDRLVAIRHAAPITLSGDGISEELALYYDRANRTFEDVGFYYGGTHTVVLSNEPERLNTIELSPNVFSMLRVRPMLGRLPIAADYGGCSWCTGVLLSYGLWMRAFGGDSAVLGRVIQIEGDPSVIVGVAPPDFQFPDAAAQLWLGDPVERFARDNKVALRELFTHGIGRLKPGVSIADGRRDLQRLIQRIPDRFPGMSRAQVESIGLRAEVIPFKDVVVGVVRTRLGLVLAAAGLLLLLTWANTTNLALVRAEAQRRETAVERALGATTRHLAARCLAEGAILGIAAGGVGLTIAAVALTMRFGFHTGQLPRLEAVHVDVRVIVCVVLLVVASTLLLGAVAMVAARPPARVGTLTAGLMRMTASRSEQHGRRLLVGGQIAIALTLLITSGLMTRSFWRLADAPLGFQPAGLYTFFLPVQLYDYAREAEFHDALLARLRAVPGVQAAEASEHGVFPFTATGGAGIPVSRADMPAADSTNRPAVHFGFTTPGYFRTMGIPLLAGRTFETTDVTPGALGVMISAALARALFGNEQAVGKEIRFDPTGQQRYTIVGVVGNVPSEGIAQGPSKTLYLPLVFPAPTDPSTGKAVHDFGSYSANQAQYVLRTTLSPAAVLKIVRRLVHETDPRLVVVDPAPLADMAADSMAQARLLMLLLLAAAGTALTLGVIGLYGVLAYAVSQRRSELGIRIALGASPESVVRMVVRQGAALTLVGIVIGLVAAFALTRALRSLLYEVSPSDATTFIAMAMLLFGVALLASFIPARRAGQIDPVRALKGE